MNLQIVYQDEHYIAINKPAGLLVHRSPIDRHETQFALQLLRDQIGQRVYPIHRLDKPTSGILLFGLHQEATSKLGITFQAGNIYKRYFAIVRGFAPSELLIDYPVKAIKDVYDTKTRDNQANGITQLHTLKQAQLAIKQGEYTHSRYSLVQLEPKTGYKHQLRYHLKHISHPIIGDAKYGKGAINRAFAEYSSQTRLFLSAYDVEFLHPYSLQNTRLTAPLSGDFLQALDALQWRLLFTEQGYYSAP